VLEHARIICLDVYVSDLANSRTFYEQVLGLRVIEETTDSIMFNGGQIILALKHANDYGILLPTERDGSADIVFLVEDLNAIRNSLEKRGVVFNPTSWYEVGGIADFYDPDSHWLTLYQPSDEAMTWPSADKIRAVIQARQVHSTRREPSTQFEKHITSIDTATADLGLDGKEIIYLFVFVKDPHQALAFYHDTLGLHDIEGGPCSQLSSGDQDGVIKYDTGGILLSTHFIDDRRTIAEVQAHSCPPRVLDFERMKGVAPTFCVTDIEHVIEVLARKDIRFIDTISPSAHGKQISFEDPSGHLYYLYEPSPEALHRPSGVKIQEILAAPI
jgi:catechol 2,3-dioxygenase-like lactoylglutathione lyase family enzyme